MKASWWILMLHKTPHRLMVKTLSICKIAKWLLPRREDPVHSIVWFHLVLFCSIQCTKITSPSGKCCKAREGENVEVIWMHDAEQEWRAEQSKAVQRFSLESELWLPCGWEINTEMCIDSGKKLCYERTNFLFDLGFGICGAWLDFTQKSKEEEKKDQELCEFPCVGSQFS